MFNTFLTNILNSYLGEIVEDLDIDNLGSGAINGDILLIDLKLRPDALVWIWILHLQPMNIINSILDLFSVLS